MMPSTVLVGSSSVRRFWTSTWSRWAPPPKLTVSEWADRYRQLSPESSAEIGQWETARAEYQRGIMDAVCDPELETIVGMTSAQIGKTEIISNVIAYFVDQDPSPMLLVFPTLEIALAYSKDRLAPMIRDNPRLRGKVKDVKTRHSGNTLLHKTFPGGHITMAGANSPASLSSRPVRIVLCDEVDRFPESAGTEGDPVKLAQKRSNNFWNRKLILMSTPTIKGRSRIESAYQASDQRRFAVPCPRCGCRQILKWCQVHWPNPSNEPPFKADRHRPDQAVYQCESCQAPLDHAEKLEMVQRGRWEATADYPGTAGFWINELWSPWVPLSRMAADFLAAKQGGPLQQQVFTNTSLAETWELRPGEQLDQHALFNRREPYPAPVPAAALVLTAGVDIQQDRIEIEVKGWGRGEESWGIEEQLFYGATTDPNAGAWASLDAYLQTTFRRENGDLLAISCTCIDTGFRTKEAYAFIGPRQSRRIFGVKGSKDRGKPLVSRPRKSSIHQVTLFEIGTDTAKATIHSRLQLKEPGPGYFHFPMSYDPDYFKQLVAEKLVTTYRKGYAITEWTKEPGQRNEALDRTVYAMAALAILSPNLELLSQTAGAGPSPAQPADTERGPRWLTRNPDRPTPRGGGWVKRRG